MTDFPYQIEGAKFLSARKSAYLADEPRVGKTRPAIRACDYIVAEDVLWITKGSARADHRRAWEENQALGRQVTSIYTGADKLPSGGTIVISYDLATGAFFEQLRQRDHHALIMDEAHRIKTITTKRTQHVLGVRAKRAGGLVERCEYAWALSGSPFPNHYGEIYPVARALFPDALMWKGKVMDQFTFERRFCVSQDRGFGPKIVGNRNAAELAERLEPYFLRRKFNEVWPDASKPVVDKLFLDAQLNLDELTDEERKLLEKEYAPQIRRAAGDQKKLDAIMKDIERRLGPKLQRLTGEAKAGPLAAWVAEQLEDGIDKIVLFAWHRSVIDKLAKALAKYNPLVIDGRTTGRQKDAYQQKFQTDPKCRIVIGQIVAAGEAINLAAADTLVLAEASWSPGDNMQACRRIVNVTKTAPVSVYFGVLAGSIDERIQDALAQKMRDISLVLKEAA